MNNFLLRAQVRVRRIWIELTKTNCARCGVRVQKRRLQIARTTYGRNARLCEKCYAEIYFPFSQRVRV